MLSSRQCKLARLLTQDTTLDSQIIKEYISISADDKKSASKAIDNLLQLHDMSFDKGFGVMINDFKQIATDFNISPSTLFCIYMADKSK